MTSKTMSTTKAHAKNCPILSSPVNECECDSYHTFNELYEHRIVLFMALCRYFIQGKASYDSRNVWCSLFHSDGTCFEGWFIMGIGKEKGNQITYHLPMSYWPEAKRGAEVLEKAPEFDGHTSEDVINRLKQL